MKHSRRGCVRLTVRLVILAVHVDCPDTANLVCHVVDGCAHGPFAHSSRVPADEADKNRVAVWKAVDARQKGVSNPRTSVRLNAEQGYEEGQHPDVAACGEEKALVEFLREPAKDKDLAN